MSKGNESVSKASDPGEEDLKLVRECLNGATEAFDELIKRHASKLYQTAYGLTGNRQDAEEVVQDAFVRAYRALDKFRGDASFATWMHRIVMNLSRNKYQWNRRRGLDVNVSLNSRREKLGDENSPDEISIPDTSLKPDRILQGMETENRIMAAFEKLPDAVREAMLLRHVSELPYDKIAELLNCKMGTVKSRLARGRDILRQILFKSGKGTAGTG